MIKIANALETDAYQFLIPENIENRQTDIIIPELKSALKKNIDILIEEFFTQHFN